MTPDELGNNVELKIIKGVDTFKEGLEKTQSNVYKRLLGLIKELATDNRGHIKRTAKNITIIHRINRELGNTIITDTYKSRVGDYLKVFSTIEATQKGYFGELMKEAFNPNTAYLAELKRNALISTRELLLESGIDANFTRPIKDILQRNVIGGASFSDMHEELRSFIIGNDEIDGQLLRYSRQVTSDSLHTYAGSYQQAVGEELGLEFVKYTGGAKDTTRDFCSQRIGKYYHKSEVEKWASLKWAGKMRGTTSTSIFQNAGGYNCRHIIVFVSDEMVPESVKSRKN